MRLLQSLTRGLDTLDYMSRQGEAVRLTDVASALGVEKSKAAHILKTLVAAGYAEQDDHRRYRLTGKMRGRTYRTFAGRHRRVQGSLASGARRAGGAHAANARIWPCWSNRGSGTSTRSTPPCLSRSTTRSARCRRCIARRWARRFSPSATREPEDALDRLHQEHDRLPARLREEIEATRRPRLRGRRRGIRQGIRCVARPVFDDNGRMIAAIGVSGPSVRVDDARLGRARCDRDVGHSR